MKLPGDILMAFLFPYAALSPCLFDSGFALNLLQRVLSKSATAEPHCHFLPAFEERTR